MRKTITARTINAALRLHGRVQLPAGILQIDEPTVVPSGAVLYGHDHNTVIEKN